MEISLVLVFEFMVFEGRDYEFQSLIEEECLIVWNLKQLISPSRQLYHSSELGFYKAQQ